MIARLATVVQGMALLAVAAVSAVPAVAADRSPACAAAAAYSDARNGLAVLILKDGRPVCAAYADGVAGGDAHPLYSGTKSFAAAMAVLAAEDGLLDLDEPVSKTIGEWRDGTARQSITIRQLLTLVSGISGVVGRPPSFAEAILLQPESAPGTHFAYGPAPFQIFGEVLRRKLAERQPGDDPASWLTRRLFNPIGLNGQQWRRTPDGNPLMPQGLSLTPADWARFGEWVRLDGAAGGKRLIAPERLAAFHQSSAVFPGYGLGWWLPANLRGQTALPRAAGRLDFAAAPDLPADLLMAAGAGNQRLYVSKRLGITVVRFARLSMDDLRARQGDDGWSDATFLQLALKAANPEEGVKQ